MKQDTFVQSIESDYNQLSKFYDELDVFSDSICKVAIDSAKVNFAKKNFILYSFAPGDSSPTTAQLLRNRFKFIVLQRPYKSDVFEFSFNRGMIKEYEKKFGFNPIDSMTVVYESLKTKGLIEIPEKFGTRYSDLVDYCFCKLDIPKDTNLHYPYPLVKIGFRISPSGKPDSIKIMKTFSAVHDSAAFKLVKEMPNWRPCTRKGEYVPVYVILPIRFNSEEKAKRCSKITS